MRHLTAGPAVLARLAMVVRASPPTLTLVPLHHEQHRLVEGRADRLVDSAARLGSRRQVDSGQVAVVDVARDDRDRGGRLAVLPGRQASRQLLELDERGPERGAVLRVERLAQPFAETGEPLALGPLSDSLAPRLQAWMPRGSNGGTEVASTTYSHSPEADLVTHCHSVWSAISYAQACLGPGGVLTLVATGITGAALQDHVDRRGPHSRRPGATGLGQAVHGRACSHGLGSPIRVGVGRVSCPAVPGWHRRRRQ